MAIKKANFKNSPALSKPEEENYELSLRPKSLEDYIWQENLKSNLKIFIGAAKWRNEPLEHLLFYWPPGLWKTSFANVIAVEMWVSIKTTSGPAITKTGDLAAILSSLKKWDILFIDEIHRLKTNVEEILYSAMEDYKIDIVMWTGPWARSMRINIPKFTLIWATTKVWNLSAPLRDRFWDISRLEFYTNQEMKKIIKRSSDLLSVKIDEKSLEKISACSRATPRIANRILRRLRDFAEVKNNSIIDFELTFDWLKSLWIDETWLNKNDKDFLELIVKNFSWWPVWLSTLAIALHEDKDTIEEVVEPFLIQNWFVQRTQKWRIITEKWYKYLGIIPKK